LDFSKRGYWSGRLYKLKICQYDFFFPVRKLSSYKSVFTNFMLTQKQHKKCVCVLSSHRTPHVPSASFPPRIQEILCFCNTLWLLSLEIKRIHLYSTRCHSKTAGKNHLFLFRTSPKRSAVTSITTLTEPTTRLPTQSYYSVTVKAVGIFLGNSIFHTQPILNLSS